MKKKEHYLNTFFDAYWKYNQDLSIPSNFYKNAEKLNIDPLILQKGIKDENIKEKLKQLTNNAFSKKIFGAPTFVYNEKIFWGQDRLEYAIDEYLG